MKAAGISELKKELKERNHKELLEFCVKLARFRVENKELLSFLLFDQNDIENYIKGIREEIETEFRSMNMSNLYYVKKSLRKILRRINKYIRYAADRKVEAEILICFCSRVNEYHIKIHKSPALNNLYNNQLKKIRSAISSMHIDLQYEYNMHVKDL